MDKGKRVAIIGLWHLGTVASACLASYGNIVIGIDPNGKTITGLKKGETPVYEPGLAELVKEQSRKGNLSFTTDFKSGLAGAEYVIIAFDTPVNEDDTPDLTPILKSVSDAVPYLKDGALLIISSQVPIGTCDQIALSIRKTRPALKFSVVCMPENLKLGIALSRFMTPDFIFIGATSDGDFRRTEELFSFVTSPKIRVDLKTAEMIKHALNAYTACNVSFANELGNLCDKLGVDEFRVAEALHLDPRVGKDAPLRSGLGYGGGTVGRDVNVLRSVGKKSGTKMALLEAAAAVNKEQNRKIAEKLELIFGKTKGLRIGVLGLTYKPGTNAIRRSASIDIIRELVGKGASVKAYDPMADLTTKGADVTFERVPDASSAADGSDALLILTGWPEFKEIGFAKLRSTMSTPVIIDALNMLDGANIIKQGFIYVGMGRGYPAKAIKKGR